MTRKPLTLLFCHRDMLEGLRVGVVVPARDEIEHIRQVIGTLPDFVDVCIVVDDGSSDGTRELLQGELASAVDKLIFFEANCG